MTKAEAKAEARRRRPGKTRGGWPNADAWRGLNGEYFVGVATTLTTIGDCEYGPCGVGDSWEAAFADADRRAAQGSTR